jgi:hypothetical protein
MSKKNAVEVYLQARNAMQTQLRSEPTKELLSDLAKHALPVTKEGKILQGALVAVSTLYGALSGTTIIGGLLSGGCSMAGLLALINMAKNNNGELQELARRTFALASRVKQLEEEGVENPELSKKLDELKDLVEEAETIAAAEPSTN